MTERRMGKLGYPCQMSKQMHRRQMQRLWPLYGLDLRYRDWSLRLPDWADLQILLPQRAIEITGSQTNSNIRHQEWALLQGEFQTLAHWLPQDWRLSLCIRYRQRPVGLQVLLRGENPCSVSTDSWVAPRHRRQGHGFAARLMVLDFAFTYLGAQYAISRSWENNIASNALNQRLGYQLVATTFSPGAIREREWRLCLQTWRAGRHDGIEVLGLTDECRELLGVRTLGS